MDKNFLMKCAFLFAIAVGILIATAPSSEMNTLTSVEIARRDGGIICTALGVNYGDGDRVGWVGDRDFIGGWFGTPADNLEIYSTLENPVTLTLLISDVPDGTTAKCALNGMVIEPRTSYQEVLTFETPPDVYVESFIINFETTEVVR